MVAILQKKISKYLQNNHCPPPTFHCSLISFVLLTLWSLPALADDIKIINGGSFSWNNNEIYLYGISAPDIAQQCGLSTYQWSCGEESARTLGAYLNLAGLRCEPQVQDNYGRNFAICFAGDVEINNEMVRHGMAMVNSYQSKRYMRAEFEAKRNQWGIWKHAIITPTLPPAQQQPDSSRGFVGPLYFE